MNLLEVLRSVVRIYTKPGFSPVHREVAFKHLTNKQKVVGKERLLEYREAIKITRIRNMFAQSGGAPFESEFLKKGLSQGKFEDKLVNMYLQDTRNNNGGIEEETDTIEKIKELASIFSVIDVEVH
ncbi:hypothetical protein P4679_25785 [Priestia megaterium]|uniref:hypothetical protein n=1 Tax=Priestia megaterium TaxID=1404 RepID=UPI002E1A1386|nr:hypothetical protein [Priestia megaterium]